MNNIEYYILSLLRDTERIELLNNNVNNFPCFKIIKSVNGYDIQETIRALKATGLRYDTMYYRTYGTLANFITKYNILCHQIENKIPYICFIEDDLELLPGFTKFIKNLVESYDPNINIYRLDNWGEGYITSLNGAKNIQELIKKHGIIQNVDDQLREYCGAERRIYNTPWKLISPTNEGDCLKTLEIDKKFLLARLNDEIL